MGILQLNSYYGLSSFSVSYNFKNNSSITTTDKAFKASKSLCFSRGKIKAVGTTSIPENQTETAASASELDPPSVKFAFVSSVLLPDGTPDVHFRIAPGGQKLRDIMLDSNIELYGPYVVEGNELLSPRTDKEKEKLKRNPKNWRLACQTTVGKADSSGLVVIQQLPEWKGHEWTYGKVPPPES